MAHWYPVPALKPGRVIRVTFSPGHPGLTRFTIYPGLTRIGSREKQNCSFDDMETYKRYRVALSRATPTYRITNISLATPIC